MTEHKTDCLQALFSAAQDVQRTFPEFSFFVNDDHMFVEALKHGYLEAAKWIKQNRKNATTMVPLPGAFPTICANGHLDVIQWLYQVNLQPQDMLTLWEGVNKANQKGHQHVVQWLKQTHPEVEFFP
jgi:hypothetical protein